ncbi:MAG TPA: glycosyltransferase family 4 protein [Xanthobacteraceae bacterium]|nr:glycosyltransferase family 4 protein [Xanthobacteraceae bacterium]
MAASVVSPKLSDPAAPKASAIAGYPRVVFLVTEDWYFVSHRLPMARAAREAGFEVHVATRVDRHATAIEREGFKLHALPWRRGSLDPRDLVPLLRAIRRLYRDLAPDIAHQVSVEASALGSLAALGLPVAQVNAITGLGTAFYGSDGRSRSMGRPVKAILRTLLRRPQSTVLVQNPDDRAVMLKLGVKPERIALIPGSGVDTEAMQPLPEPEGAISIAFVGRLLGSKGIRVLLDAHERLNRRGRDIRLLIAGTPDPANRDSVSAEEVAGWARRPNVLYLGHVSDIRTLWATAHIGVLPSRVGEGLPLSMIEAAACGRALIATDMPGCREIVRHDVNGLLVPRDDVAALADAIDRLAGDAELRRRFARASRALAEQEFSSARVSRDLVDLYRAILNDRDALRGGGASFLRQG